jgi:preprotein translocase SecF subunit
MRHLRLVPDVTNIDFMRHTRLWLIISALGVLGSIGLLLTRGLNLGVDFRGGTIVMAATPEPHPIADYRAVLTGLAFGDVGVTEISDDTGQGRHMVLMRLGTTDEEGTQAQVVEEIRETLTGAFPGIEFLQVDSVGGKVSGELVRAGALALALSFLGIMVYVWLRFEWQFALGSVLSLMHDAIMTIGLFSLLQLEFNLTIVAAVLTVIGYSINDTVVVFDRMRREPAEVQENAPEGRAEPVAERDAEPDGDDLDDDADRAAGDLFLRRRRRVGLRAGDDLRRRDLRDVFLDLRRGRDRAAARGQARLVQARPFGGRALRRREGLSDARH